MKVADLRSILNKMTHDGEISIQLPDNEPPVDFIVERYEDDILTNLVLFPIPPTNDRAVWDHDNNVINWYSLDSDSPTLEGGEG
jgi:hypothetical protein